jgi:hypothetical protein
VNRLLDRDVRCSLSQRSKLERHQYGMNNQNDHQAIYRRRFAGIERVRVGVWQTLARHYFNRWIKPQDCVLDLGAGYCEFINNVTATRKFALDSNPATVEKAAPGVVVISQEASQPWPLERETVDVVFSSNFFEHLTTRQSLAQCLIEAFCALRRGGRLIALGPNIRFCPDTYWGFFDHHLPLSDRSMVETLEIAGFEIEFVIPRFLPFNMSNGFPYQPFMVRFYLALPFVQRLWGKQFLVVARKPDA